MQIGFGPIRFFSSISCGFHLHMLSCMVFSCFVEVPQARPEAVPQQESFGASSLFDDKPVDAAKEFVPFVTRARLEAANANADDGPTPTVTSEKALAQKQSIVASQDQDDAAHQ